eukprot:m.90400 g.90400  ORF g.90400 m.90400 type:complete len:206 (+) comp16455_c0_seq7:48-665(+)
MPEIVPAATEPLTSSACANATENKKLDQPTTEKGNSASPIFSMDGVKSILPISTRDVVAAPVGNSGVGDANSASSGGNDATDYFNGWFAESEVEKDPMIPSLSRKQRVLAFVGFATLSIFCLSLSLMMAPFIVLKARKFSLLFSMGSLFALVSVAMLRGPSSFLAYMTTKERLPTSAVCASFVHGGQLCGVPQWLDVHPAYGWHL